MDYEEVNITHKVSELNLNELSELINHIKTNVKTLNPNQKTILCANLFTRIRKIRSSNIVDDVIGEAILT